MSEGNGWTFPGEVKGWLTVAEGRKLADLARDRRVLEIGSFEGRSTICMAQTAAHVVCVDPFDGRATPDMRDTEECFFANVNRYGLRDRVTALVGTTQESAPMLKGQTFDLIFIDGDHSAAAVATDVRETLPLLAEGGTLAFHDYKRDLGPTASVGGLLRGGGELLDVVDSLAVVKMGKVTRIGKPLVLLVQPRRGAMVTAGSAEGFYLQPSFGAAEIVRAWRASSLLDHTFNALWATALNLRSQGISRMVMLHDDVCPAQGFVDVLLAEQDATGADIVSCVIPIKNEQGLTSTAVETDDPWQPRRLTMHEVHALPETFGDAEVGGEILLNTGLWICDLTKLWVDFPTPMTFQCLNQIIPDKHGEYQAQVRPEDWEFSRAARARGARLLATRKVTLLHAGEQAYPNDQPWGTWQTDNAYVDRLAKRVEAEAAVLAGKG